MDPKTKRILIISIVVFVLLCAIAFYFYRKGKKTVTIQAPPKDSPETGTEQNNPFAVSSGEITAIVKALFSDMDGYNWNGHNSEPYEKLNSLSDTDFVKVYNKFNLDNQAESGETLFQWINNEQFAFDDVTESILERMGRLNLK